VTPVVEDADDEAVPFEEEEDAEDADEDV